MKIIVKYKDFILLTIGTFLVIISFCLLFYDKFELLKNNVYDDIELQKYRESNVNIVVDNEDNSQDIEETPPEVINEIEVEDVKNPVTVKETEKKSIEKEFIGYLEIKKVNLKQGLVSKKSYYNNVNRNIQILSSSDYPDVEKGNVILAAHSGTSSISYFKNLYKLVIGDEAKIYYKGFIYTYKIVNIYNVPKVGSVVINRDLDKNCLTLITCTHNSKTEQTVYILERISSVKESDV